MAIPTRISVTISDDVQCTGKGNERLLIARARLSDDPDEESGKINWMVQWFLNDNPNKRERSNSRKIQNPKWHNTKIIADWRSRNPHATLIEGARAQIKVDRNLSRYYTCWMWPGEEFISNNSSVSGPAQGWDIGPTTQNDPDQSLSGVRWNDDDEIGALFANGVYKIKNQYYDNKGSDHSYRAKYEYLWSGKNNVENNNTLDNDDEIYWYVINADSVNYDTEDESCSGDSRPNPTPEPTPEPEPSPRSSLEVTCKDYVGETLRASFKKCSSSKQTYQWQKLRNGQWRDEQGEKSSAFTPQYPGTYRCSGFCGSTKLTSNNCFIEPAPVTPTPTPTPSGCQTIELDWPGAPNFPLYNPSGVTYTLGEFPQIFNYCTRGNEVILQRGNTLVDSRLRLEYANVPDEVVMDFLTHFNTFAGTSNLFELSHCDGNKGPAVGWDVHQGDPAGQAPTQGGRNPGGASRALFWGGTWKYKAAPVVTGIRPGISTIKMELTRISGPKKRWDGSEVPWPNYPNFPSWAPSDRTFTQGDWPRTTFAGPDRVQTGRITGPQRDSILDLTYQNQADMDMSVFFRHYMAERGQKGHFNLQRSTLTTGPFAGFNPGATLGPGCKQWYEENRWHYAEPPVLTRVKKGVTTARVKLRCPFVQPQFIKE